MEESGPELLLLACGDGVVAVPLAAVVEIGRVPALTRLPGLPPFVAGVANWRGRVTTVLSLTALLGSGPEVPTGPRTRLVLVRHDGWTVGLLVDGVVGLGGDAGAPQPLSPGLPPEVVCLLRGQVVLSAGPAALLELGALAETRRRLPAPAASRAADGG